MLGKRLQNLLKMAFGVTVLGWIAWHLEFAKLAALAARGEPRQLALGVGCLLVAMMVVQWTRLHLLIKSYTPNVWISLKIFFVGALFNNFLPSNIGGDAVRLMYLKGLRSENWGTPFMLLLLYRFSSFALLVLAGLTYVIVGYPRLLGLLRAQNLLVELSPRMLLLAALLLGAALIAVAVLRRRLSERVRTRVSKFLTDCRAALALLRPIDIANLIAQTLLFHWLRMLSFYFLVRYVGQQVALWDLMFVISATAVIAVLPVTVAGLGVLEASITGLLVMYGVELSCAGAVALVNRAVLMLSAAIGGVIYLRTEGDRPRSDGAASSASIV